MLLPQAASTSTAKYMLGKAYNQCIVLTYFVHFMRYCAMGKITLETCREITKILVFRYHLCQYIAKNSIKRRIYRLKNVINDHK